MLIFVHTEEKESERFSSLKVSVNQHCCFRAAEVLMDEQMEPNG